MSTLCLKVRNRIKHSSHFCSLAMACSLLLYSSVAGGEPSTSETENDGMVFHAISSSGSPSELERFCFDLPEGQREELPVASMVRARGLVDAPIVMVYRDGTILWLPSYKTLTMGEIRLDRHYEVGPYFRGQIDPLLLEDFLTSLDTFGAFEYAGEGERIIPVDLPLLYTVMFDPATHRVISLGGFNEHTERNGDVFVAHDYTSLSLKDMRRDEALNSQPPEYRRYRIIRRSCLEWLISLPELVIDEPEELGYLKTNYICFKPSDTYEGAEPIIPEAPEE